MIINNKPATIKFGNSRAIGRNLNQVQKDFFSNILPESVLRPNALIVSSFLLVVSRIFAVNKSAAQAKGTTEEHHRRSEAIKTSIREIGGFSLSFLVLRFIEGIVKKVLRRKLTLPEPPKLLPHTWKQFIFAIKEGHKNRAIPQSLIYTNPDFSMPKNPSNVINNYKRLHLDSLFFKSKRALNLSGEAQIARIAKNIEWLLSYAPTLIGTVPAIILSGYFLERFTQNHAASVAEKLSHQFQKKDKAQDLPNIHSDLNNPFQVKYGQSQ